MPLQQLQSEFLDALHDAQMDAEMEFFPEKYIAIYQRNIQHTHIKSLENIYPFVNKLLGNDFFYQTANEYYKKYPSCCSNLNEYGEYFSEFISDYEPLSSYNYLIELAQFEWACHYLRRMDELAEFNFSQLETFITKDPSTILFSLNPNSKLFNFTFPILKLADYCLQNSTEDNFDMNTEGDFVIILQINSEIIIRPLSEAQYRFLECLDSNHSLKQAYETAHSVDSTFNLEIELVNMVREKMLTNCVTNN